MSTSFSRLFDDTVNQNWSDIHANIAAWLRTNRATGDTVVAYIQHNGGQFVVDAGAISGPCVRGVQRRSRP